MGGAHKRLLQLSEDDVEVGRDVHGLGEVVLLSGREGRASAVAHCLERAEEGTEEVDRAGVQFEGKQWIVHVHRG